MATPETTSSELDPTAPPFDGSLDAAQGEEDPIVEDTNQVDVEARELPAYTFDSSDKTLVGIGSSRSADSSRVRDFDSSDRTLAGIGPSDRAKRAEVAEPTQLAESANQPEPAELTPESVPSESLPTPCSEPHGPFVASSDEHAAPLRLPMQKGELWLLALSVPLVAAAAFLLLRGIDPGATAARPRVHAAEALASLAKGNETRTGDVQFEPAVATSLATFGVEMPNAQAPEEPQPTAPPLSAPREEKQAKRAQRRADAMSAGSEPLGTLDVTSNSPSGLVLDGRPLGKAPRVLQLAPGPHTVLFIHPERGRMSVTVIVRPGRTTTASANF